MELIIDNVSKKFDDNIVLDNINYSFQEGKITSVLGRNGAGKTTLFNIINGEMKRDGGKIYLKDQTSSKELDIDDVGMLYSENFLPDFLTGYEYVKFFMDISGKNEKSADDYLDDFGFTMDDRDRLIKSYSHGMKSKISLISLFIQKPKIILLDEPLTSLDLVISQEIKKILLELKNDGHIILLSTHMLELAKDLSDEISLIHNKKLLKFDQMKEEENFDDLLMEALRDEEL